ncbi:cobalamin biosynthesis protein CbiD [Chondrocystis sp. NIES-4102]|nr:cobalamin biosynthesis protein CbiD [Chondrocystis sp. NIES-4102]
MSIGYTLPVFACASAIAALRHLQETLNQDTVTVNLIKPDQMVDIKIEQVAKIDPNCAIAITRSDSGQHLDITHNIAVWAKVSLINGRSAEPIVIEGGEGIGKYNNQSAIYSYAQELIKTNLQSLLGEDQNVIVTIILPQGQKLAQRTSNEAFGVIDGLSLLGTTGIVQPLTAPNQLEAYQAEIKSKAELYDSLVFCIGENGLDLAQTLGINPQRLVKTANWLGSMLVTAGFCGVESILLFGYHGKLIKLAGGIFHTHNHLADARLEILTAYCAKLGFPSEQIQQIFTSPTTESALEILRAINSTDDQWVDLIYQEITRAIDSKSQDYIYKYTEKKVCVGSILFDRTRKIIKKSDNAILLLPNLC